MAARDPHDYGFPLTDEALAFLDELTTFLDEELTDELRRTDGGEALRLDRQREWQRRLFEAGLAAISWPAEHGGRSASPINQLIFTTEMARRHPPEPINRSAINQLGPTIIQWGTEAQKAYYLPRILSGEDIWCQGFSEPDAGSDLASLRTRAVRDGDVFIVDGQKVWTSKAQYAQRMYLLARTDPDAPKHEGISFLVVDLDSDGIEVRPVRQITGTAEFNEVFLTGVRVPAANLIGPLNAGWKVANSTLGYERVGQSRTHRIERRLDIVTKLCAEVRDDGRRPLDDAAVRDQLVRFTAKVEALREIAARTTAAGVRGVAPGPEASVAKLLSSEVDQAMANFGLDITGVAGTLERGSPGAAKAGNVARSYLLMRAATLGAGTSEIQRNVIAHKLLGLPRDP